MARRKRAKNKRGFTVEQCRAGGRCIRGGESADEVRQRVLADAKGLVLREGVTYSADGVVHWQKRRALLGRTDQIELVCDGVVVRTLGESGLRGRLRWLRG